VTQDYHGNPIPQGEGTPADHLERIGRYRIKKVLGEGGFGLVYLAHDEQLNRLVAVKVPHVKLISKPEDAEAYLAEARTVAGLDHAHIVPVYKENEYLSDGITGEILNTLAKVPGLRVPARTSSFVFRGKNEDVRKIGELLSVRTVLEGSVRKAGDRLRITAQLINAADGFHLWSETYDRNMTNIFDIQSDLAQCVVQALQLVDAMGDFRWVPKENYPRLRAYAEAALKLDPLLAEAHVSMAQLLLFADWDFPGAKKELELALKLNPNLASAHSMYSTYACIRGKSDEGLAAAQKALELDPLSLDADNSPGWSYYLGRDFKSAAKSAKQAMELDPGYPWNYGALGLSLVALGKADEAVTTLEKLVSLVPVPLTKAQLAYAYAAAGERLKAEAVLKELEDLSTQRFVPPTQLAFIRLSLGQKERALELFEHAVAERDSLCLRMKVEPGYDSVRNDPRFQTMLKKVFPDP